MSVTALRVEQDLTIQQVAEVRTSLQAALAGAGPQPELVLDLERVGEVDGAGLQLLLALARWASARGGRLALRHTPAGLARLIAEFGLSDSLGDAV